MTRSGISTPESCRAGALARAKALSPERRSEIARIAAAARYNRPVDPDAPARLRSNLKVDVNWKVLTLLERLRATGLWGESVEKVAEAILLTELRRLVANGDLQ